MEQSKGLAKQWKEIAKEKKERKRETSKHFAVFLNDLQQTHKR